ncbi:MAG: SPFH domain-containing protein [Deltaproteobacteria bacterium]|nr:SPFH domain-containing protein [Deltaproteobacteria bacterium]
MAIWDRITSQFIEIIEWLDDDHQTLVWRFPVRGQEIKNGAKLIVREGQSACFINEGKLADVFGPGTYTLTTQNLPILSTLKGWKYGFNSPFKAEVYFVSATEIPDLKWGTKNPVMMRDPEFGPIRIRAFGQFSLRVTDPSKFLRTMSGTDARFEVDEILGQLKGTLVSRFTEALATAKIAALDLAGNYGELAKRVKPVITADFEEMGLGMPKFIVENISLPENVEKMIDTRSEMAILGNNMQQYAQYQMASSIPAAARTPNSLAGAGMGLVAGMNMANQFSQQMGAPQGYGQPQPGYAPAPGYVPAPAAYAPPPAPAAPAGGTNDLVERIRKLDALKAAGVLTEDEYAKKKSEILSSI